MSFFTICGNKTFILDGIWYNKNRKEVSMEEIIGCHVSFRKDTGLLGSLEEALSYGANTFMFYTGAPQNTIRFPIQVNQTLLAYEKMKEKGISLNNIIVHAPYIINLANKKNQEFGVRFLKEELKRVENLGISKLVLHPGSHVGVGSEEGIKNIIDSLNQVLSTPTSVKICLETMAGKGSEIGKTFEEIKAIIKGCIKEEQIMVCLDTCHIHDAGYDLKDIDHLLDTFDQTIGLSKLACIHINDSKNEPFSHKDRHENIGYGYIGFETLLPFLYHEKLKGIPKILETPYVMDNKNSYPPYLFEIAMLKEKKFSKTLLEDIKKHYRKD